MIWWLEFTNLIKVTGEDKTKTITIWLDTIQITTEPQQKTQHHSQCLQWFDWGTRLMLSSSRPRLYSLSIGVVFDTRRAISSARDTATLLHSILSLQWKNRKYILPIIYSRALDFLGSWHSTDLMNFEVTVKDCECLIDTLFKVGSWLVQVSERVSIRKYNVTSFF